VKGFLIFLVLMGLSCPFSAHISAPNRQGAAMLSSRQAVVVEDVKYGRGGGPDPSIFKSGRILSSDLS